METLLLIAIETALSTNGLLNSPVIQRYQFVALSCDMVHAMHSHDMTLHGLPAPSGLGAVTHQD